jgi:hypothetical protein
VEETARRKLGHLPWEQAPRARFALPVAPARGSVADQ